MMADAGRPEKITPEVIGAVVTALRNGASRADAAQFAGIDASTLRRWMQRGEEEPDGLYGRLRAEVIETESRVKVALVGCVLKAAATDWRAALALLQCRHPAEFGDKGVLFLVKHALQEMEKAAEAAGVALPQNAWEQAWATVARQLAQRLPEAVAGVGPGGGGDYEGFDSQEDLDLALKLLGRRRRADGPAP